MLVSKKKVKLNSLLKFKVLPIYKKIERKYVKRNLNPKQLVCQVWPYQIKQALQLARSKRFFTAYYRGGFILLQSNSRLNYLMVYKLYLKNLNKLLSIQIVSYRSSYLGDKKSENLKKCFLWNLYFVYRIRWFRLQEQLGSIDDTTKGWSFDVLQQTNRGLDVMSSFNYLVQKLLYEVKHISGYKVHHDWLALRPYSWVPLNVSVRSLWTKRRFSRYELYKYWVLDGRSHILQYRILCSLPDSGVIFQKQFSRFTMRWLKAFVLRMWKHPTLYDYTYLSTLNALAKYGYNTKMPLDFFNKDVIWQADSVGIRMKQVLDSFVEIKVESRGFFTEKLMEKHWKDSLTSNHKVGKMLRADWMYRPSIKMLEILSIRWKLKY
jgi:hypothetical protein